MFDGVLERVQRHLEARTTDEGGELLRLSASLYTDPDRFARETEKVFRRRPLAVGLAAKLRKPGDFVAREILGTCFFVVVGQDGKRRAFVNACRHRGAKLLAEGEGGGLSRVTCSYHGWTYDAAGALAARPCGADGFRGVPSESLGLVELPIAERFGLVFVTLDPEGSADVDYFSPLAGDLDFYGVGDWVPYATRTEVVSANWKAAVENFLEGYHVGSVHAKTVARKACEGLTLYDRLGEHERIVFPLRTIWDAGLAPGASARDLARHLSVNYFIFPSTVMLVVAGEYVFHETFTPLSPDSTRVDRTVLAPALPKGDAEENEWRRIAAFFDAFVAEDFRVIEAVQQGARSLRDRELVVGRNEQGVADLHRALDRALGR